MGSIACGFRLAEMLEEFFHSVWTVDIYSMIRSAFPRGVNDNSFASRYLIRITIIGKTSTRSKAHLIHSFSVRFSFSFCLLPSGNAAVSRYLTRLG
ncbi:MAG: hypothetical protein ACJAT5_000736 [Lentimonas sp.]|jgi:hypothetical protein